MLVVRHRLIRSLLVLLALLPFLTAAAPAARSQAPAAANHAVYLPLITRPERWPPMNRAVELRFIELLNAERARNGLGLLTEEPCLVAAARRHAADLGATGETRHDGADGSLPHERTLQEGCVAGQFGGEVVGHNATPEGVFTAFMLSPGHRAALMQPNITRIGVGVHPSVYGYAFVGVPGNPPPPPPPPPAETIAALRARLDAHRAASGAAPLARDAALDRVAQRAFDWLDESNRSSGYSNICPSPDLINYSRLLDWAAQEGYGGEIDAYVNVACIFDANGKTAEQVADEVWAWAAQKPWHFKLPRLAQAQWDDIGIVVDSGYSYMVVIVVGDRP